jgi:hypothetical protein
MTRFGETLLAADRRPFAGRLVNPFSFFTLFTAGRTLRKMTVYQICNILCEGKSLNDLNQLWMKANLRWTVAQTANWTVGYGTAMFCSGQFVAKRLLPLLGARGFTSLGAACGFVAMLINGAVQRGWAFWAALLVNTPTINGIGAAAVKSAATKHAMNAGLGPGEYAGAFANLRALVYIVGPLFYSRLYALCLTRGHPPGAPYFVCAVVAFALPELMHRSWSDEDMAPKSA